MKKLALIAAPLTFALAACGGTPAEEAEDVQQEVAEAAGDVLDEQAEAVEAQADAAAEAGDVGAAAELEAEAEAMEDKADEM